MSFESHYQYLRDLSAKKQADSSGAADSLAALVASYNTAYGEAKTANEQRYQQMLDIADQTTNQRATDISSSYADATASAMQNLARLGMANTTIAPTLKMGYQRDEQAALNTNADQQQQTKLGIIEKRTDAYPDSSSLMSLANALGKAYPDANIYGALSNLKLGG